MCIAPLCHELSDDRVIYRCVKQARDGRVYTQSPAFTELPRSDTLDEFCGDAVICERAERITVVICDRFAIGRRFGEPDVS